MNTHHEIPLNDPALGAIDVRETSASSLILPLFENDSASIVANAHSIVLDGEHYELPKLLLLGERGGGVPIRVGIFAGLDAGRVETVAAAARLLLQCELSPALARDYAIFGYPIVNVRGFGTEPETQPSFQQRWRRSPGDDDARFFRGELQKLAHNGIIQLRSSLVNTTFTATTRSALLAKEVVAPALNALRHLVPVGDDPVRVLSPSAEARRADFAAGRLLPEPSQKPWPFEIELYAPGSAEPGARATALFLATLHILRNYRRFISHGGEL